MRPDMIGPRRLQPAKIERKPISFLTNEDPSRVLKSQILPGVTEGQTNGAMPQTPSTRPGLFVGGEINKGDTKVDRLSRWATMKREQEGGHPPVGQGRTKVDRLSRWAGMKQRSTPTVGQTVGVPTSPEKKSPRPEAKPFISPERFKEITSKAQEIEKKIPGQQSITEPLGPGDMSAASSHHDWKASDAPHIEAAKHFIQADHFSRQPGGEGRAKMHQTALSKLKAQGASPQKEHYKQAMSELPPHFSKLMNSLDAQDQGQ